MGGRHRTGDIRGVRGKRWGSQEVVVALRNLEDKDKARGHANLEHLEGKGHREHVPRRKQTPGR